MTITVTAADITNGRVGDCLRDPIALALRRLTGRQWRVDRQVCYPDGNPRPFVTPRQVSRFIEDFDNGKPVKPISFNLEY